MKQNKMTLLPMLISFMFVESGYAVEVAPRITDREIIESLTELKAGQRSIEQRFESVNQRFESVNQRFESVNQHFESMDKRFESMDKRFESIDQRFASLESTMLALFSALIVLITALFGYIAWDRRTALKPLEREMQALKHELERDFELKSPDGSILIRMRQALRELAQEDQKMAQVLRSFSLM